MDYLVHDGVALDPDMITKNRGARTIAKFLLTTLWGKFGQKPNHSKTMYIHDLDTWLALATDPSVDIHAVNSVNGGKSIMVAYDLLDDYLDLLDDNLCTSVIIAAWTTWMARKKLYVDVLNPLGKRVCYMDTDSVIYQTHDHEDPNTVHPAPWR